jgi:leucyl aminopeptidase (aminopeptidase T)
MVDFAKIREENAKRAREAAANPVPVAKKAPDWLSRISHLLEHHLAELTDWEEDFLYSNKAYLVLIAERRSSNTWDSSDAGDRLLSAKVKAHIAKMEDKYCTSVCHALNKANIPHS